MKKFSFLIMLVALIAISCGSKKDKDSSSQAEPLVEEVSETVETDSVIVEIEKAKVEIEESVEKLDELVKELQ